MTYNASQAAALKGVCPRAIKKAIATGRLKAVSRIVRGQREWVITAQSLRYWTPLGGKHAAAQGPKKNVR